MPYLCSTCQRQTKLFVKSSIYIKVFRTLLYTLPRKGFSNQEGIIKESTKRYKERAKQARRQHNIVAIAMSCPYKNLVEIPLHGRFQLARVARNLCSQNTKGCFSDKKTKANQLQKQCTQRSKECSFKNFNVFGGSQQRGGRMRKEYLKNNKRVSEGSQRCTRKELRTCYNIHKHMFAAMSKTVCSNTESCLKQSENVLEARRKNVESNIQTCQKQCEKGYSRIQKKVRKTQTATLQIRLWISENNRNSI